MRIGKWGIVVCIPHANLLIALQTSIHSLHFQHLTVLKFLFITKNTHRDPQINTTLIVGSFKELNGKDPMKMVLSDLRYKAMVEPGTPVSFTTYNWLVTTATRQENAKKIKKTLNDHYSDLLHL